MENENRTKCAIWAFFNVKHLRKWENAGKVEKINFPFFGINELTEGEENHQKLEIAPSVRFGLFSM